VFYTYKDLIARAGRIGPRLSIDTRTIRPGDTFLALKGDNFDGHDFIGAAIKKEVSGIIISSRSKIKNKKVFEKARDLNVYVVDDTLRVLGDIAGAYRRLFDVPLIGITGSSGKTTVKELTAYVLGKKYDVLKTQGTRNNLIGLPLTLLGLTKKHDICVLEMGTNISGEIKRLAEIARPSVGIITNIGPSHLEYLGSVKNVFKEKIELINSLDKGSWAVLNKDDAFLAGAKIRQKTMYFGIKNKCPVQAKDIIIAHDRIGFKVDNARFRMGLAGEHNIYNALAAISAARLLGMRTKAIAERLNGYKNPLGNRLSFQDLGSISVINDTYNSNPLSFRTAVSVLNGFKGKGRCVMIVSDMLELGKSAEALHKEAGRSAAEAGVDCLITVGNLARFISSSAIRNGIRAKDVTHFRSKDELKDVLDELVIPGDIILIKGSRGMRMEDIVEELRSMHIKEG